MPLPGHQNGQSNYRLVLTLSIAFLLHTLILAAVLHSWAIQREPESSTVHFTLLAEANKNTSLSSPSRSSAVSAASQSEQTNKSSSRALPEIPIVARPAQQTATDGRDRKPSQPADSQDTERPQQDADNSSQPVAPQSAPSPEAPSSAQQSAGSPVRTPEPVRPDERAQIPEETADQDPYVSLLWRHISDELDSRPVRSIRDLKQVRTVRLELHLMENGALRRVDTIENSGKPTLDQAARQSALAASPYPEPPESAREQGFRFQVELRFTPRAGE